MLKISLENKALSPFFLDIKFTVQTLMCAYVLHLNTQIEYQMQDFWVNWKSFHTETQKT